MIHPSAFILHPCLSFGSCRSRTCQARFQAPRFSGPVPAPMGSELPKSTTGVEPVGEPRLQLGRRPPASCSESVGGRQRAVGRNTMHFLPTAYCLLLIASYGTRTHSDSVTSCYAHPYTNEAGTPSSRASAGIEPCPRHSQCRVLPLHQTRHPAHTHAAEEEGFEPSGPLGPARLANACDQAVFASLPN